MPTQPNSDEGIDYLFIDAIARGWGLMINCRQCADYRTWPDVELAERFVLHLDQKMNVLRGRVKCPKCGDKEKLVIYPFNITYEPSLVKTEARHLAQ